MSPETRTPPLLDEDHATFIRRGVSIVAASSDASNTPSLARAIGCTVSADRWRVTIFVAASSARRLLDDVRGSGRIAVVFSEPPTHRTIQIKGNDATIIPVVAADHKTVTAYAEAMVSVIALAGHREPLVRAMLACPPEDLTAVTFTPAIAFIQTPGPGAGAQLKG